MNTKYGPARTIISFINIIGWIGVVIGAGIFVMGMAAQTMTGPMLMGSGLMTAISSLILVAIASVAVAMLDTGDEALRTNLLLSAIAEKQGVDVSVLVPKDSAKIMKAENADEAHAYLKGPTETIEHRGETITKASNRYYWNGQDFLTLPRAKSAIDKEKVDAA